MCYGTVIVLHQAVNAISDIRKYTGIVNALWVEI